MSIFSCPACVSADKPLFTQAVKHDALWVEQCLPCRVQTQQPEHRGDHQEPEQVSSTPETTCQTSEGQYKECLKETATHFVVSLQKCDGNMSVSSE